MSDLTTTPGTSLGEMLRAIVTGELDDDLDQLSDTIHSRRRLLEEAKRLQNIASLTPGTAVRIVGNIRPKAMVGLVGTVVSTDGKHIRIDVHPRCAHLVPYRYPKTNLGVPANCLERI